MQWRVAKALLTLREQIDARWPGRRKDNDGTIGDAAHQTRRSDHDPDSNGVVTALDITHDPRSGCDSYALAEVLRASRDPRIEYLISNHRICSSEVEPWVWRPYHGINPHDHHMHVSVIDLKAKYDDPAPWNLDAKPMPPPVSIASAVPPTLRKGDSGDAVKHLQDLLHTKGLPLKADGEFGTATAVAVRQFQQSRGLVADGVCGPQTFNALKN